MFDWNALTSQSVVHHRLWIYWAVVIPLTFVTVSLYFAWDYYMSDRDQSMATQTAPAGLSVCEPFLTHTERHPGWQLAYVEDVGDAWSVIS